MAVSMAAAFTAAAVFMAAAFTGADFTSVAFGGILVSAFTLRRFITARVAASSGPITDRAASADGITVAGITGTTAGTAAGGELILVIPDAA